MKNKKIIFLPLTLVVAITVFSGCSLLNKETKEQRNIETEKQINIKTEKQKNLETEKQEKINNSQATSTIENNIASSTNEIDISDWKTYRNDKYGFNIKYPKDWVIKEDDNSITFTHLGWRNMPEGGGSVNISVEDFTLEDFIKDYNSSDVVDGLALSKIISQKEYDINGIDGYKLIGTTAIGLDQSFIFIPKGNKAYIIGFHDYDNGHIKIIKTFEFIN